MILFAALIALLQIKHLFADYFLQTPFMLITDGKYLHLGRAVHVMIHMIGSAMMLAVFGAPFGLLIAIVAAEGAAHYHIDWGKAVITKSRNDTPADAAFWRLHGTDQALHQLTYVAMACAWASFI